VVGDHCWVEGWKVVEGYCWVEGWLITVVWGHCWVGGSLRRDLSFRAGMAIEIGALDCFSLWIAHRRVAPPTTEVNCKSKKNPKIALKFIND
jgi:hypothetical protein